MSGGPENVTQTTRTSPSPYLTPGIQTAANSALGQFNQTSGGTGYGMGAYGPGSAGSANNSAGIPMLTNGLQGPIDDPAMQTFGTMLAHMAPDSPIGQLYSSYFPGGASTGGGMGAGMGGGGMPNMGNYGDYVGGFDGGGYTPGMTGGEVPPGVNKLQGAYDQLYERGAGGSPLINEAQNLTQGVLQGNMLSPDTNPYLEQTFNRAADLTRGRLDSEFAGSGRNLGASMPARSEELQTLASQIYGGNYGRERMLQNSAVGQALSLGANDFNDINAMLESQNLPLDTLINRIQGLAPAAGGTAVSSSPVQSGSPLLGAIGGASSLGGLGAALGGGFGVPLALLGGLGGLLGSG